MERIWFKLQKFGFRRVKSDTEELLGEIEMVYGEGERLGEKGKGDSWSEKETELWRETEVRQRAQIKREIWSRQRKREGEKEVNIG